MRQGKLAKNKLRASTAIRETRVVCIVILNSQKLFAERLFISPCNLFREMKVVKKLKLKNSCVLTYFFKQNSREMKVVNRQELNSKTYQIIFTLFFQKCSSDPSFIVSNNTCAIDRCQWYISC